MVCRLVDESTECSKKRPFRMKPSFMCRKGTSYISPNIDYAACCTYIRTSTSTSMVFLRVYGNQRGSVRLVGRTRSSTRYGTSTRTTSCSRGSLFLGLWGVIWREGSHQPMAGRSTARKQSRTCTATRWCNSSRQMAPRPSSGTRIVFTAAQQEQKAARAVIQQ